MRSQVLNTRVGSDNPAFQVFPELLTVVHIHLDKVLVETIGTAVPPATGVNEETSGDVHVGADQARERLAQFGVQRRKEIVFGLLCEFIVFRVPSQITQTSPFKDKRSNRSKAIHLIVRCLCPVPGDIYRVSGNSTRRVKRIAEKICQVRGLCQKSFYRLLIWSEVLQRASQEVISYNEVSTELHRLYRWTYLTEAPPGTEWSSQKGRLPPGQVPSYQS